MGMLENWQLSFASQILRTDFKKYAIKASFFLTNISLDILPEKSLMSLEKSLKRTFVETYKLIDEEFLYIAKNR